MPTISTFFGILIQMYWREHGPPHFAAWAHRGVGEPAVLHRESLEFEEVHPTVRSYK